MNYIQFKRETLRKRDKIDKQFVQNMKIDSNILKKLSDFYVACKHKYYKHLRMAEKYKTLYHYTTTPIIVLSSLTTVLASYNGNVTDYRLAIAVAIASGLTTIGQALVSFFEYNSKYEAHLAASNKYLNLARLIETEVYINLYNSTNQNIEEEVKFLFETIHKELINIQESEPILPAFIISKKFKNIKCGSNDINDGLLDISEITPLKTAGGEPNTSAPDVPVHQNNIAANEITIDIPNLIPSPMPPDRFDSINPTY